MNNNIDTNNNIYYLNNYYLNYDLTKALIYAFISIAKKYESKSDFNKLTQIDIINIINDILEDNKSTCSNIINY